MLKTAIVPIDIPAIIGASGATVTIGVEGAVSTNGRSPGGRSAGVETSGFGAGRVRAVGMGAFTSGVTTATATPGGG